MAMFAVIIQMRARGRASMSQGRMGFSGTAESGSPFATGNDQHRRPIDRHDDWTQAANGESDAFKSFGRDPDLSEQLVLEDMARRMSRLQQAGRLPRRRIAEFVRQLFDDKGDRCQRTVDATAARCGDPQKVVEVLFEPAARMIGENWCADECDFMKVTIAMNRIQVLFRRLAAEFPSMRPDLTRCVLLTPAPGEQHGFGLAVVEDAFRRAGWQVDSCLCGEEDEMFRLASTNSYQIIGISVSVERLMVDLSGIVLRLRTNARDKSVFLMAGGSMVMQNPRAALDVGFDLLAVDASAAVGLAESAMSSRAAAD